jgi:transposase
MEKLSQRRYTLEYKQEAVRLVTSGQRVAAAAKALGIVEQTLANWVKAEKAGQLRGIRSEQVSAKRMEINRLRGTGTSDDGARHIGKATAYFAKVQR